MSLKALQQQIDDSFQSLAKPYWDPMNNLARIVEEVGEVSRILNHQFGEKPKKPDEELEHLGDELADVIHACLALANSQGIDMDPHMQKAINKINTRDKDRYAKK